jgi:hypothetical protein
MASGGADDFFIALDGEYLLRTLSRESRSQRSDHRRGRTDAAEAGRDVLALDTAARRSARRGYGTTLRGTQRHYPGATQYAATSTRFRQRSWAGARDGGIPLGPTREVDQGVESGHPLRAA